MSIQIQTKHFGTITIEQDKIITFKEGLLGLNQYKDYTIIYDSEDNDPIIVWLQSTQDKDIALPIINPLLVDPTYAPVVEDELLKELGELKEENLLIFSVVVIPEDIKKLTTNLKAPIILHTGTRKGRQVIVENEKYDIRFPIYEHIKKIKEQKVTTNEKAGE